MSAWWWAFWAILVESGVWLLAGFLIAGVLHVLVPRSVLERALGGKGIGPVVRGALIGAPLPLCSCSVIPTAAGLKRSGASRGASAAFAVASPEVDVPAVGLTWGLLGPWFAVTRPIVAVAIAVATGLSLDRMGEKKERQSKSVSLSVLGGNAASMGSMPAQEERSCCGGESESKAAPSSMASKLVESVRFALVTLPASLAGWMLIGLALAALITVLVPSEWSSGSGLPGGVVVQSLVALVVGIPLYVCATSSTPMALAMIVAGVEPGAALVFLLAGPATNPATIAWVVKDFGVRSAAVYVGVIAGGSFVAGVTLNGLLARHMTLAPLELAHEHGSSYAGQIAGGVLLAVLMWAVVGWLVRRVRSKPAASCCAS